MTHSVVRSPSRRLLGGLVARVRALLSAPLLPCLLASLPAVSCVVWYGWSAYATLDRYRRSLSRELGQNEAGPLQTLPIEALQIGVHDALEADIRRFWLPARAPTLERPRAESHLQRLALTLKPDADRTLLASAETAGKRGDVRAHIAQGGGPALPARVRLHGRRTWHVLGTQRSLEVKLDKGELLGGYRSFDLINDPTPLSIGEQLSLELARSAGLLTPPSDFVRVAINGRDFGVYRYETEGDESLLRNSARVPGSIYASALPSSAPSDELWAGPRHWTKVAARTDSAIDRVDRTELERFLRAFHSDSGRQFRDFAEHELDVRAFAQLDALDVAFGGDQRDFRENHRYHFDPYRARWEPVAEQLRGFHDGPAFNLVENPLLLRLKFTPGYSSLRDRLLYELLTGPAEPAALEARARALLERLAPELASDPYWDAYHQLPAINEFYRRLLRPETLGHLGLVVASELTSYERRHARLLSALERNPLYLERGTSQRMARRGTEATPNSQPRASGERYVTNLRLVIDGPAGASLDALRVSFAADCPEGALRLLRSGAELAQRGSTALDPAEDAMDARSARLELAHELPLYPSVALVPRAAPSSRRGSVRAQEVPIAYELEVVTSCPLEAAEASGRNLATGAPVASRAAPPELLARLPPSRLAPDAIPALVAGEVAPHPWQLEEPAHEAVSFGPGRVAISETRVFEADQPVTVRAGTRLEMAPDASLIFLGSVRFEGTSEKPIEIVPAGAEPWGGLVIRGAASAGSGLHGVHLRGGTRPHYGSGDYPALVDVHDSRDISIDDCDFAAPASPNDTLHFAYVDAARISNSRFDAGPEDALDLEFSEVDAHRLRIVGSGDDGLDLMGSRVNVTDSVILSAKDNGISCGEGSEVRVRGSLIADCGVGVLAKNAGHASLSESVLYRNGTGLRSYQRTVRYAGASDLRGSRLFVAESVAQPLERSDRARRVLDAGELQPNLPEPGALEHLRSDVLGLEDWQALGEFVSREKAQALR
jgi:hypothetical protein